VGAFADEIVITPDGKTAYVATSGSPATVTPINLATNTAGPAITIDKFVGDIVITPDSRTAYVATTGRFGTSNTVIPINTVTNTKGPAIPLSKGPGQMAITPNGATLYVTLHKATGSVVPISTATNTVGTPIPAGIKPSLIAISPDGTKAYVLSETHNTFKKIYLTSLRSITIATGAVSKQILVKRSSEPNYVTAMVFIPSGKTLYALGYTRITGHPAYLVAVDTATNKASPHFPVGRFPGGMAITP